jgi:beta-carotene hydroxylase
MELDQKIPDEFSFEKEKAIAKSLSQRFQWEMVAIGMGQATIFLSLWPLTLMGYIPLWAGFLIATLCACMAYLPSHEAQHGNYSRGNPKRRWIDSLVGNFTLITLIYPYEILRVTHMKHHAYTNHPKKRS